ncbi:MAG TPA: hydroxymyristoyl-ACP dehydratase, partial [Gemmataceae bacterium]|nr:hydroxymyristoyl-ACP dehydratase [Gemmataceae bacterium]
MRFNLIDRIVEVRPGQGLQAVKNLTLGEEYLADHFPTFPVMPGVLMLETLVEAGAWLLRLTDDFASSVIVLREAKGVKYG